MTVQQTEQYFKENPDKLRESIVLLIHFISQDWMPYGSNDSRPNILLRYLYLYHDTPASCFDSTFDQMVFDSQFETLLSQIAMYLAGWQGDIIQVPEFLKF